jgi:uncharacterized membrane protein YeaQ/YmgE (transglycosylase-associated protein family)
MFFQLAMMIKRRVLQMTFETPMIWIAWVIAGAITGLVLNKILPAHHHLLLDVVMGALGCVLGGLLTAVGGAVGVPHYNLLSIVIGICGATVMLALVRWTTIGRLSN